MNNQRKIVILKDIVFYIILGGILTYLAIFGGTGCVSPPSLLRKTATVKTYATIDIHDYSVKLTKLPTGSIPTNSPRLLLSDSTLINIKWTQYFATKPYAEQDDPVTFGTSSNITIITIPDAEVDYDDNATSQNATWSGYIKFSAGEWQLQLDNSIIDAFGITHRSKFSDAMGLYIDIVQDPVMAPESVTIIIGE